MFIGDREVVPKGDNVGDVLKYYRWDRKEVWGRLPRERMYIQYS